MVSTELGTPVSESSTKISKFYDPTDSEHKLHKTRIKKLAMHRGQNGIPLTENLQS